jgi:hypothetical protein
MFTTDFNKIRWGRVQESNAAMVAAFSLQEKRL